MWSQDTIDAVNRNRAIAGRNRNLEKIWRMLGCPDRFHELPLEPMPTPSRESNEQTNQLESGHQG